MNRVCSGVASAPAARPAAASAPRAPRRAPRSRSRVEPGGVARWERSPVSSRQCARALTRLFSRDLRCRAHFEPIGQPSICADLLGGGGHGQSYIIPVCPPQDSRIVFVLACGAEYLRSVAQLTHSHAPPPRRRAEKPRYTLMALPQRVRDAMRDAKIAKAADVATAIILAVAFVLLSPDVFPSLWARTMARTSGRAAALDLKLELVTMRLQGRHTLVPSSARPECLLLVCRCTRKSHTHSPHPPPLAYE